MLNLVSIIDVLLQPSVTLTIGILTILISRNSNRSSAARERLEAVYHPLFITIEPFLYKSVSYQEISSFIEKYNSIEKDYSLFINPTLRQIIKRLSKSDKFDKSNKNNDWFLTCKYISKEYDKLCKLSHMPIRSISYRINNRQFKNKTSMLLACIWITLPSVLFCTLIIALIFPKFVIACYVLLFFYVSFEYISS